MKFRSKALVAAIGLALAPFSTQAAWNTIGSGELRTDNSTLLVTSGEWNPSVFNWTVDFDSGTSQYRYTYVYSGPTSKGISHFTVETSSTFTASDVISQSFTVNAGTGGVGAVAYGEDGSSPNDDDGTPLFGMKWNTSGGDPLGFTAVVTTLRAPIWGDIFIKDGQSGGVDVQATNAGYLTADPVLAMWDGSGTCATTAANPLLCTGTSGWNWVAAPDTTTGSPPSQIIPEPGTLLLSALGTLGFAAAARRRNRRRSLDAG